MRVRLVWAAFSVEPGTTLEDVRRLCACTCNDAASWQATEKNEQTIRDKAKRMRLIAGKQAKMANSPRPVQKVLQGADPHFVASLPERMLVSAGTTVSSPLPTWKLEF